MDPADKLFFGDVFISTKEGVFSPPFLNVPRNNPLNFGADPDKWADPGIQTERDCWTLAKVYM